MCIRDRFIPINSRKTLIREIPYALPDERREMKAARYLNWRINREVNAEDTELINFVQEGMETSAYSSGPLAESEICLIDSAEKIRNSIPVSRLEVEPDADEILKINENNIFQKLDKTKYERMRKINMPYFCIVFHENLCDLEDF